jgi:hypothetical protein
MACKVSHRCIVCPPHIVVWRTTSLLQRSLDATLFKARQAAAYVSPFPCQSKVGNGIGHTWLLEPATSRWAHRLKQKAACTFACFSSRNWLHARSRASASSACAFARFSDFLCTHPVSNSGPYEFASARLTTVRRSSDCTVRRCSRYICPTPPTLPPLKAPSDLLDAPMPAGTASGSCVAHVVAEEAEERRGSGAQSAATRCLPCLLSLVNSRSVAALETTSSSNMCPCLRSLPRPGQARLLSA